MPKVLAALFCALGVAVAVSADGGPPYRRTTPRGSFGVDGAALFVGMPGGRAWGIESALIPVPDERTGLRATIDVSDAEIREAFVRVAWYDKATGRPGSSLVPTRATSARARPRRWRSRSIRRRARSRIDCASWPFFARRTLSRTRMRFA